MYQDLHGKKLLYLGGVKRARLIVERARELGVYVIVADYNEDSPAKSVADEGVLISATDVDALVDFCVDRKIDGVMTAYVDILMPVCLELTTRLGLPCYLTEKMIEVSTNKKAFKDMCSKYGVPTPRTYEFFDDDIESGLDELRFPVFVKPLDGSGSKGADVCADRDDFARMYEYARARSRCNKAMVEDYLIGEDIGLDYVLVDGKAHLLSMWDRKMRSGRPAAVNHADLQIMPSRHLDLYMENLDASVSEMIADMGFKDGIVFLQGYAHDGGITFFEMGCRLGGTWPFIDEHFCGVNPIDMLVHHALTGKMIEDPSRLSISPRFPGKAAVVNFLGERESGEIGRVVGLDAVASSSSVVSCIAYYSDGDSFDRGDQSDIDFFTLHFVADTFEELVRVVNDARSKLDVVDKKDNSLLAAPYDLGSLQDAYGSK